MIKNIIFDFDGVILDSIPVKTEAFRKLFKDFPADKVEELIIYHIHNGGKSRYKKIEYFFDELLNWPVSKETIKKYATKYSELTKQELANKKYLIDDSIAWIKENYKNYNLHIASGADENDLKYICDKLEISKYFISINGSPKIKSEIVKDILENYNYKREETILIGDSINDYEAAKDNKVKFYGYNNDTLIDKNFYIDKFKDLKF
jgi:HAD superfamily hydrolase (TIGR01549 family)